jgi:hypothetical protein
MGPDAEHGVAYNALLVNDDFADRGAFVLIVALPAIGQGRRSDCEERNRRCSKWERQCFRSG